MFNLIKILGRRCFITNVFKCKALPVPLSVDVHIQAVKTDFRELPHPLVHKQAISKYLVPFNSNLYYSHRNPIDLPSSSTFSIYELPPSVLNEDMIDKKNPINYVEIPSNETTIEKQAARLIVIRRRKMKKHQLRKLRKRMKYEWAKVRQRRELKKEKIFQAKLIAQIKEAETFDAAAYVADILQKAQNVSPTQLLKEKQQTEYIIKQKLGIKD